MKTARSSETTEDSLFYPCDNILETSGKNFKIPVGFSSLQGKPVLLIPWMVYTVISLIANTVLYIVRAAQFFAAGRDPEGTGCIIGTVIYIRK
jgi:hypothetical protein